MMQRIQANSGETVKNASPVDVISKDILEAVTNKILNLRYLVFKDVETWAELLANKQWANLNNNMIQILHIKSNYDIAH
jgi:hypothetical protein